MVFKGNWRLGFEKREISTMIYRRHGVNEVLEEYKECKRNLKKEIRKTKLGSALSLPVDFEATATKRSRRKH